jgi:Xaa-Pro aminopeptidase
MAESNQNETNQVKSYPKIVDMRLDQIHFSLEELKAEALVVTYLPNIRYLTNFSGSAATIFITKDEIMFFTDDRYEEQIKTELYPLPGLQTYITRDVWSYIMDNNMFSELATIAFEADRISYADAVAIRNQVRPLKFKPAPKIVEPFTIPKSPEEFENIKQACDIAIKTNDKILELVKPGVTELDLAIEIAYQSRKMGSEGDPFDIIVVSGPRGALVHGKPSERKLKKGDLVTFDFGCKVNGFITDITRTVGLGKITKEQKSVYKIVHDAKEAAIANVRPGMNGKILDNVARSIIQKEGYGDYFQHSLGHGIGLEPHEMPIITFRMDDQVVPENCVIAIEPGIYLPEKFGIRIEDNVHVTRTGGRHITKAPEELPVL